MGRFGFEQNLLLLTLCRLRFDPNVVAGDLRPVNDVLQRDLQAWWPLVGTEAYDPHNQLGDDEPALQLLGEFSLSLSASRHSMGLIDRYFDKDNTNNHRGFTGDMLRGRLQQLLMDIDRVSVWSIARPIPTRPSKESPRTKIFSWKEDLKIVALSLGFYHSVHGDISDRFWSPSPRELDELCERLGRSRLFQGEPRRSDVEAVLCSLEMIFDVPVSEGQEDDQDLCDEKPPRTAGPVSIVAAPPQKLSGTLSTPSVPRKRPSNDALADRKRLKG